ncbi:MAG: arsenate reductase ArsC [Candidatus Polarisedimenticolia bacterium]
MNILFLCTGNAARSLMAEAIARSLAPPNAPLAFFSAGTIPQGVHPLTTAVLREAGLDVSQLSSKGIEAIPFDAMNLVVTLCDDARQACPAPPAGARHLHWGLRDPASPGIPEAQREEAFRAAREEVRTCVKRLMFELAMDPSLRRRP